jgi:hypothetical protein
MQGLCFSNPNRVALPRPDPDPRDLYRAVVVVAIDRAQGINNGQPSLLARWIKAFVTSARLLRCHNGGSDWAECQFTRH